MGNYTLVRDEAYFNAVQHVKHTSMRYSPPCAYPHVWVELALLHAEPLVLHGLKLTAGQLQQGAHLHRVIACRRLASAQGG